MVILDVREVDEFKAEHVADSILCPLSQFDLMAPGILKNIKDSNIVVLCRSGNRAKMALNELKKLDLGRHHFSVFEGGMIQWKKEGKAVVNKSSSLPIMRQVQITASILIILAFVGSKIITHDLVYLALFVGAGLGFAGYFWICPMANILQKMPWNNKKSNSCCN